MIGLFLLVPFASAAMAEPSFMDHAPPVGASRPFAGPAPRQWKLGNGLEVLLLERHTAPLVAVELVLRTGSNGDPAGKGGLAALTADLLDESAGERSALEMAQALDRLGAQANIQTEVESTRVTLELLGSHLAPGLELLADMVLRPRFEDKDFIRVQNEHLATLRARQADPRAVAEVVLNAAVYGDSAYGHPKEGTLAQVRALARHDVVDFYRSHLLPNRAVLIVIGDAEEAELRARIQALFGGWAPGTGALPAPPKPPEHRPRLVLVDKPGAPQSVVRVGELAAPRQSPDYAPLQALSMVLGGSFTSRLERNLRERNNFAYGAAARVDWRRGAGPLLAYADVHTETTDKAIAELLRELKSIGQVTPEELEKAKALEHQGLVERLQSGLAFSGLLGSLIAAGMPASDYRLLERKMARVSPKDVARVARRYVVPERATIVVVGDLARVRGPLERAGLGPAQIRDAEGKEL